MNLDIFKVDDPSGKMSKESYVFKNYPKEYDLIIEYCLLYNINVTFKEKTYLFLEGKTEVPCCKNSKCDNIVKFKNSTIGYLTYCSNKCISSDPNIKKQKELRSVEKYGTKIPSQSIEIKDKIIKTNIKKYGGNSPMSSEKIREKSKKTLLKNWNVINPSQSKEILEKRIESFKKSDYKENFKKSSLEKYGVEHHWMDKEIHNKTIVAFYNSYKDRIIKKIENIDIYFKKFDKDGFDNRLLFGCGVCNSDFSILAYQFYYRVNSNINICTSCYPIAETSSIVQVELYNFIKENYDGDILQNVRDVISPYEIDIYLPDLKIGFEFNGVFWHSDRFKNNNYHLNKYKKSIEHGVRVVTIWEDDWYIKREICESFILNKINKSNKIMGRKTIVKEVNYILSKSFLDENHLQGDCKSSIRLGLYFGNELVSLMTFSKLRLPLGGKNVNGVYELTRFCNKVNKSVLGGASKLIDFFIKNLNPDEIHTYSDNLISNGDLYDKLKFKYLKMSDPGYWYVINGVRRHRFNFRKHNLVNMGYDSNKSEEEIMLELGHYRIYNAGNKKWIWYKQKG